MASTSEKRVTQIYFGLSDGEASRLGDPPADTDTGGTRVDQKPSAVRSPESTKRKRERPDRVDAAHAVGNAAGRRAAQAEKDGDKGAQAPKSVKFQSPKKDSAVGDITSDVSGALAMKERSPWLDYEYGYCLHVGGSVVVGKRKRSPVGLVAIKLYRAYDSHHLSLLPKVQGDSFVKYLDAYHHDSNNYIVLEYMPISLLQVLSVPRRVREIEMAAILGQVLNGIAFLEMKDLIHGNITCQSILLNDAGEVKITLQEGCTFRPDDVKEIHPDMLALDDITMQLSEKHIQGAVGDDSRWSSDMKSFYPQIKQSSAKNLLKHAFLKEWQQGDLILLVSLALVGSRRFYGVTSGQK